MSTRNVALLKGEAPIKLVAHFINNIEQRKVPEDDPLGIETLGFLIEALSAVGTKTQTWGTVAKYVLEKANDRFRFSLYKKTLRALAPHVSVEMAELIVKHFVQHGEVAAVIEITKHELGRPVYTDEVNLMVKHHHEKRTSTKDKVWETLSLLGGDNEKTKRNIERIVDELTIRENDFIID